jgi:hypothetical protein
VPGCSGAASLWSTTGPRCGCTRPPEPPAQPRRCRLPSRAAAGRPSRAARPARDAAGRGAAQRRRLDQKRLNSAVLVRAWSKVRCPGAEHVGRNAWILPVK